MNELSTASVVLLDVLVVIVTMSALACRESRWSRRVEVRHRDRTAARRAPRRSFR